MFSPINNREFNKKLLKSYLIFLKVILESNIEFWELSGEMYY